jgi:N4-(beta-N-acetylglucosaminyl)-L-asparaginase
MFKEKDLTRRHFFAGLGALGISVPLLQRVGLGAPVNRPLIVTSKTLAGVREAVVGKGWEILQAGGSPLDAAEKAVNVDELDPRDTTVGKGDPNEEGFLQLDACVMSGPDGNTAGAVAALENIKTPCSVARLVMERTDHVLLVGKGALKFAKMQGFKEEDLLTDEARRHYRDWKESLYPQEYYHPPRPKPKEVASLSVGADLAYHNRFDLDTINVLALDGSGGIAGVTSTIGHHFKIVGRVGDSAIIGAGLYVDNGVGAAGCTGHGEESIRVGASLLTVEKMREGMSPQEACRFVCNRVVERNDGKPMLNIKLVALNKSGEYGCCSVRGALNKNTGKVVGLGIFIQDARGPRLEPGEALLPPMTEEEAAKVPLR